jgi:hypothetical protein
VTLRSANATGTHRLLALVVLAVEFDGRPVATPHTETMQAKHRARFRALPCDALLTVPSHLDVE